MNINKRDKIIVGAGMAVFVVFWTVIAVFKYRNGGYNGFDLAIYNNTFWNTVHGRFFASSIHQPSYLGDHAEWLIAPLALIYFLFQSPLTLVILQIIALGVCAVPIYLIAKLALAEQKFAFIFPLVWLLNFTVCYNAIWEFHLLVFSLVFIFFAAYYFIQKRFRRFLLFLFIAMLCREDVAFVALGFALTYAAAGTAWCKNERMNTLKWTLVPLALGALVFFIDITAITHFNANGVYKYASYFRPLGSTLGQITQNFFLRPMPLVLKIFSLPTLKTATALLLVFLLLPLRRPRFLLLALPSFLIIVVANNFDWFLPLQTHYLVLALPGVVVAAVYGFDSFRRDAKPLLPKPLLAPLALFAPVFFLFALGPLPALPRIFAITPDAAAEKRAVAMVPPNASAAASFAPATALSGRKDFYHFYYAWFGKNEFAYADYAFPKLPDYILVNERIFLAYAFGFDPANAFGKQVPSGDARFRQILDAGDYKIVFDQNNVVLLKSNGGASVYPFLDLLAVLPPGATPAERPAAPGIKLIGYDHAANGWKLYFQISAALDKDTLIELNGDVLPFGQGILAPQEIPAGAVVEYDYSNPTDKINLRFSTGAGALVLSRDETARFEFSRLTPLGQTINLP